MATVYLEYTIFLSDKVVVAALQAAQSRWNSPRTPAGSLVTFNGLFSTPIGGYGKVFCSPDRAVAEYPGCVIHPFGATTPLPDPPYIASVHIWALADPGRFPTNVDFFSRPVGGPFGLGGVFTAQQLFVWVGKFAFAPPGTRVPTVPGTVQAIERVRWAEGFELPTRGAGPTADASGVCVRASRHHGGYGLEICDRTANNVFTHKNGTFIPGFTTNETWERVYLRIDTLPTTTLLFWRLSNSTGAVRAAVIGVTPLGNIAVFDQQDFSLTPLLGSTGVQPSGATARWLKLDFVAQCGTGAKAKLFVDNVLALDITSFPSPLLVNGFGTIQDGFGTPAYLADSQMGKLTTAADGGCLSLDDWTSHTVPVDFELANQDWLNGTKVVRLDPIAYGADHDAGVWTGVIERFKPLPAISGNTAHYQTSSSAAAPLFSVLLDVQAKCTNDPNAVNGGLIAAFFALYHSMAAGGTVGTMDYAIGPTTFLTKAIAAPGGSPTALNWAAAGASFNPPGQTEPERMTSLALRFTPGASAHARTIGAIGGVAVLVGVFGSEDINKSQAAVPAVPPRNGEHNHWYPLSPWAQQEFAPLSPVITTGGTYVGTGTRVELQFPAPVCFFKVRRVTATIADGATWFSSSMAATEGWQGELSSEGMVRAEYKLASPAPAAGVETAADQGTFLTVVGADARSNESGVTYQYLAFMDPGARLSLAGSVRHSAGTTTRTTPLWDATFLALAGLFIKPTTAVSTAINGWAKGLGHTAEQISKLDAAATAAGLSFAAGVVTTKSAFATTVGEPPTNFLLLRTNDGTADPGIPATLQVLTYTGDGAASRTLGLSVSGVRPMWALIVPSNAASVFRDPSHTGTTSSQIAVGGALTALASTGILGGGIDQINLGSALNGSGILYSVIVFMGLATAGNGGWSTNGTVSPITPVVPVRPPWIDPPDCEFEDDALCGEEGGGGGGGGGVVTNGPGHPWGGQCVAASEIVCNEALSVLGVTTAIVDIELEATVEADQSRLHYERAVRATLRAYPWAFATRYASLAWVAGSLQTPANVDWTYAFRAPTDMVFARRLVNFAKQRTHDASPPAFRLGSDTTGNLIYTNFLGANGTDTAPRTDLEYTYLPTCAATVGDDLFRSALKFRMAALLAPSLTRNKVTSADALGMFREAIMEAQTVNAREQRPQAPDDGDPDWISGR